MTGRVFQKISVTGQQAVSRSSDDQRNTLTLSKTESVLSQLSVALKLTEVALDLTEVALELTEVALEPTKV